VKRVVFAVFLALAAVTAQVKKPTGKYVSTPTILHAYVYADESGAVPVRIAEIPDDAHGVLCYALTPADWEGQGGYLSLSCVKVGDAK
jgi:hypothetical protein